MKIFGLILGVGVGIVLVIWMRLLLYLFSTFERRRRRPRTGRARIFTLKGGEKTENWIRIALDPLDDWPRTPDIIKVRPWGAGVIEVLVLSSAENPPPPGLVRFTNLGSLRFLGFVPEEEAPVKAASLLRRLHERGEFSFFSRAVRLWAPFFGWPHGSGALINWQGSYFDPNAPNLPTPPRALWMDKTFTLGPGTTAGAVRCEVWVLLPPNL